MDKLSWLGAEDIPDPEREPWTVEGHQWKNMAALLGWPGTEHELTLLLERLLQERCAESRLCPS